jgi:peptide/nickel transport system ATP-binding protein
MNVIEIRDLEVNFTLQHNEIAAVRSVSFDIPGSKTLALVGESGSGKSVTAQAILRILPGIARIAAGSINFWESESANPVDIVSLNPASEQMRDIRGGKISMIFQEPMVSLSPLHTVGNQVSESVLLHQNVTPSQANQLSRDMLDMVGFPDPDRAMKTYPFELSGGLRQRAMIATALVCKPSLLIADEPTTALDVTIQAQILKLVSDLQSELDMSVLLITHDLGVVANVADEVVVMYHGEIMEYGAVDDIFRNPQHPYLKSLMKAIPHFDMKPGERLVPVREIESSIGDLLRKPDSGEKNIKADMSDRIKNGDVHLRVRDIYKSFRITSKPLFGKNEYDEIKAVDGVGFDVYRGECFGLVGESGCGKTTLSKVLMKALTPDGGQITYLDSSGETDVLSLKNQALFEFRRKLQFIFQDPFSSLNPRMTVFDIVREPLVIHEVGDEAYQVEMVKELMRLVGLDPRFLSRYPHSFSGGQRQRLGIARALALKPDFIICDEPVSALDVSIQAQILNLLKDLQAELNLTTIFISHNLAVVDYVADRIAVMSHGRLVEIAPKEILFNNPVHPYTRALLGAVPFPDLDKPLDFDSVMDKRSSDPSAWPAPYTLNEKNPASLVSIEPDHQVQQFNNAEVTTL